jgi:hypothetical protein
MSTLRVLPCLDSEEMAASRRQELNIPREVAAALGQSAVDAARDGRYVTKGTGGGAVSIQRSLSDTRR